MRKFITFCAAMGLILVVSGTAQALPTVTEYNYNLGTTQWVTTTSVVGSSSLELNGYPEDSINYAGVLVTNLGDPTIADFSGWDYWTRGPEFHGVNVRMWLDTPYDNYPGESWDVALNIMPYNMMGDQTIPGDTWVNLDSTSPYPYQFFAWDGTGAYLGGYDISMWDPDPDNMTTWSELQGLTVSDDAWGYTYDFGEAVIKKISIRMGGGGLVPPGGWGTSRGYLDDFTLDGISFVLEDGFTVIPEPATIALLGLGALSLLRRKR